MTDPKAIERHIICVVHAAPGHASRVGKLLLDLVGPARDEPGCLYYDIYRDDRPDQFVILDGWTSDDALAEHAVHSNVTRVVEELTPLLARPLEHVRSRRMSEPA